jgi:excisionase family DNA binding protein
MSDRVLVPLPDGRWLALAPDAFRAALEAGAAAMSEHGPLRRHEAHQPEESCVYERARTGQIPSVRFGKHVRFRASQVLEALGAAANQAVGRS